MGKAAQSSKKKVRKRTGIDKIPKKGRVIFYHLENQGKKKARESHQLKRQSTKTQKHTDEGNSIMEGIWGLPWRRLERIGALYRSCRRISGALGEGNGSKIDQMKGRTRRYVRRSKGKRAFQGTRGRRDSSRGRGTGESVK